jgi:hypothetical protein
MELDLLTFSCEGMGHTPLGSLEGADLNSCSGLAPQIGLTRCIKTVVVNVNWNCIEVSLLRSTHTSGQGFRWYRKTARLFS